MGLLLSLLDCPYLNLWVFHLCSSGSLTIQMVGEWASGCKRLIWWLGLKQGTWKGKHHLIDCPCFLLLSPFFICWAWCQNLCNMSLVSWGHLCPLPTSYIPLASSLMGWCKEQKRSWLCGSTAQSQLKHPWATNIIFTTNPKHRHLLLPKKKNTQTYARQNQHNPTLSNLITNDHVLSCILNTLQ